MTTFLVFVGTVLFLILIHEGGHFLAAKAVGMAVEEFAIGFGPALFSWKRKETKYSVRMLPLGGYVRLAGESGEAPEVPAERTYYGRPAWARFALSLSGPVANIVLAVVVVVGGTLVLGLPRLRVAGLIPDKPAAAVLQVGDVVLAVGGRSVWASGEVGTAVQKWAPGPVPFQVRRDGNTLDVQIVPLYSPEDGRYLVGAYFVPQVLLPEIRSLSATAPLTQVGFGPGDRVLAACGRPVASVLEFYSRWSEGCRSAEVVRDGAVLVLPLPDPGQGSVVDGVEFKALPVVYDRPGFAEGTARAFGEIGAVFTGFLGVLRGLFGRTIAPGEAVTGPVGIAALLGQGYRAGPYVFLFLVALISLNLALFNLVPFPALDGARMVFALYEMVFRRKVSPRLEMAVHTAGFFLLLGLVVLITFQDLVRLFR